MRLFFKRKEPFYYPGAEIYAKPDRLNEMDLKTADAIRTARNRTTFLIAGVALCFTAIVVRLFFLTIVHYEARSFKPSQLKLDSLVARGNITDRNGLILATSVPTYDLAIKPFKVKNPKEVAQKLVKALPDLSYPELLAKLESKSKFKYIKRALTPSERQAVNWLGIPFLEEIPGEKRIYPQGNLFAHLIGKVDVDNIPVSGLEKSYNDQLLQRDLKLSLDVSVQGAVHKALSDALAKYQATGGTGVVFDVNTGEVLASVSLPDFNPNFSDVLTPDQQFNKATSGIYEFGSVFKIFNIANALEQKAITPNDVFDAQERSLKIGRKVITDFRGQNRSLTVPEILMHSSNIGSARIALKIGDEAQRDFFKRLHFFETLPLQLPERAGTQYPRGLKWADITVANAGIGYAVSVSPMHLISAMASMVNGGLYRFPTFVDRGNADQPAYRIISEKTSEMIRQMMWAVVNWDTRTRNPVKAYLVGGKTGTANLIQAGKYMEKSQRTTFVGVFPMNAPKYLVLIMMEDPKPTKDSFGLNAAGWNAKPTGFDVILNIAPYLGISPQEEWEPAPYIQKSIEISTTHRKR